MAGRIEIDLFSTLDGVMQAPGGPEEDPSGGFGFGGWQAPMNDEAVGVQVIEGIRRMDALLLGRRTYDIFAAYWPNQLAGDRGAENEIAAAFDAIPKYVASRGEPELPWRDSHLLGLDLASEVDALRERHREVHVIGSIEFVHTLLAEGLFDELNLWVYPILLGTGKKVFDDNALPSVLRLLRPPVTDEAGVTVLRYGRTDRVPEVGTFG